MISEVYMSRLKMWLQFSTAYSFHYFHYIYLMYSIHSLVMPAIKVKAVQGDRYAHDNSINASLCHWCGIESYNLPPYKQDIYIIGVTIWICPYSECCDKAICFIVHLVWESCTWGCALACSKLICLMITSNREYWIRTLPYQKEHKSYNTIYCMLHATQKWHGQAKT